MRISQSYFYKIRILLKSIFGIANNPPSHVPLSNGDVEAIKGRIFLVGCPRSGTTLLQTLIAGHPQIASFPESHFFRFLGNRRIVRLGLVSHRALKRLYEFLDDIGHSEMRIYVPEHGFLARQYVDAFVGILDSVTISQGKEYWLEKTPAHLHRIDVIEKFIPEAKFIHIIRNGRDVVASLYEVTHKYPEGWGGPREIDQCIARWNRDIKITQKYIHKSNHTLVRYEQLVENPATVLADVCGFIGVEYSREMVEHHCQAAEQIILNSQVWIHSAMEEIHNRDGKKFDRLFDEKKRKYILDRLENAGCIAL